MLWTTCRTSRQVLPCCKVLVCVRYLVSNCWRLAAFAFVVTSCFLPSYFFYSFLAFLQCNSVLAEDKGSEMALLNSVNSDLQINVYVLITFFNLKSISILYFCFRFLQECLLFHRDGKAVKFGIKSI